MRIAFGGKPLILLKIKNTHKRRNNVQVSKMKKYARLIVHRGANVQPGQDVIVYADLDQPEFVRYLVIEIYRAEARSVEVKWNYPPLTKAKYQYEKLKVLGKVTEWEKARLQHYVDTKPVRIYLESSDPAGLKGINQKKVSRTSQIRYPIIKGYVDEMDNKYQWCIAGVPGIEWARHVFPDIPKIQALEALWEAILKVSRADGDDPLLAWDEHNANLKARCDWLNDYRFKELRYKASNGTDLRVGLLPNANFLGGRDKTLDGIWYNPNIPSEEVFTSPRKGDADGIVYSSKPLSYRGNIIDEFWVRFENGKVVETGAKKGAKLLKEMVGLDEGASMLGEVALVPYDSPISNSGITFWNTLYDENAACHLALGRGFNNTLEGYEKLTLEEIREDINDSMIHVDFMIGTKDLEIIGITPNGKEIQIFKNGNWAF